MASYTTFFPKYIDNSYDNETVNYEYAFLKTYNNDSGGYMELNIVTCPTSSVATLATSKGKLMKSVAQDASSNYLITFNMSIFSPNNVLLFECSCNNYSVSSDDLINTTSITIDNITNSSDGETNPQYNNVYSIDMSSVFITNPTKVNISDTITVYYFS